MFMCRIIASTYRPTGGQVLNNSQPTLEGITQWIAEPYATLCALFKPAPCRRQQSIRV
ncbi:hypothetical protein EMIT0P294_160003 [Pseudomonas sp. IT-P294]